MQSRMNNIVAVLPKVMTAMQSLQAAAQEHGLPEKTAHLVHLRASQINGCGFCVDLHPRIMKKAGETDRRILSVAAWREAPFYTDAERAALALTEALTRIADREEPVPDTIWNEAARHYDEKALAALVVEIASINVWNRFNVATRQVAGEWNP
ncbi:carboxymuconolactone decarboxylase family protein [Shinella kummerowiae]|jgi:AhpD family alkylhydroperoxidase|uniref:Carboxymuconolactone decarboxylase family protein n=1 Tax=Shinella kummerowiae TaxID=417745 RepID=A0A6N8SH04_9HYPH|nr:carboxymuconolactone decarboxylase family protein [Shinella kummerowiae]MCT7662870.1 carboxymuconolactone decarboxylase family protein [Shinella kummerowiae]MXN47971.1 carboxymuconolactone decarboxylase family protein [Shinella kummerowiae]